jgi:tRNA (guanine37-N1)-methyltransferase
VNAAPYRFDVITLFPSLIEGYLAESIMGRAQDAGHIDVKMTNPRDFTADRHRTVDDGPYGGGAGMVMMPEPLGQAIDTVRAARAPARVIMLSPAGRLLNQEVVEEYAALGSVALVCGRYEGIDARIGEHLVDECLSMGDYVVTGGELAALAVIDAVSRQLPGVLGNAEGALDESFAGQVLLEHPQYTRPRQWRGHDVPDVLLSGNHAKIAKWREAQRVARTAAMRPDLFERWCAEHPDLARKAGLPIEKTR